MKEFILNVWTWMREIDKMEAFVVIPFAYQKLKKKKKVC